MNNKLRDLLLCALCAAILCVFSVITIPTGIVPVTLGMLGVMLVAVILGAWRGIVSVLVFILIGTVGLPVFSGFRGGPGVLVGPTGGYITGYIFMALIIGLSMRALPKKQWAAIVYTTVFCIVAVLVGYAFGTIQFVFVQQTTVWNALATCVFPFIAIDFAKCVAAAVGGIYIRKGLQKAKLL